MQNYPKKLSELIEKYPACQKRTGKYKQFTFMAGDVVIKGPYKREKIEKIYEIALKMKEWKNNLLIYPINEINIEGEWYLIFPNVAKDYLLNFDEFEEVMESFTGIKHKVIKRHTVLKLSDVIEDHWEWVKKYLPEIIITFCQLYVLNVGDVGLYNVLADIKKKKIFIIDYEEERKGKNEGEFFYLSKSPRKKVAKKWLELSRPQYSLIYEALKMIEDEVYKDKLNETANCFLV